MKRHSDRQRNVWQGNEDGSIGSIPLPNIPLPTPAGAVANPDYDMVITPELERLLDKGLENLERACTTDELRL